MTTRRAALSAFALFAGSACGVHAASAEIGTPRPDDKVDDSLEQLKSAFSNFKVEYTKLAEAVSALSRTIPPVGSLLACATATIPDGWLLCDGKEYDSTDPQYKPLFAVIGNAYGGQKPTFKVPDFRGRTAMGSGQGVTLPSRSIGDYPGQEDHKLQGQELPNHKHGPHHHVWVFPGGGANVAAGGGYNSAVRGANGAVFGLPSPNGSRPDQTGGYITSDDGSTDVTSVGLAEQSFETVTPSCVVNYLVRFKSAEVGGELGK